MSLGMREEDRRITREEYLSLPEGPPYDELDEGVLIQMTPPHGRHQEILTKLLVDVYKYLEASKSGKIWPDIGVELKESRIYVPDISFLRNENLSRYDEESGRIVGPPDLVVEIISPESVRRDRLVKYNSYLECGVTWYWIVDPVSLIIEEYQASPDGYLRRQAAGKGEVFKPDALPGLELVL